MAIIPDEYRQYVEAINGTGSSQFFWQNLTGIPLMYHTEYTISANYGDKTYFIQNTYDPIIASANNTNYMFYMPKKDIHINKGSGTQYSVNETYSYTNDLSLPPLWGSPNAYAQGFKINGGQLLASSVESTIKSATYTYTDSGTLQEILTRLARNCRGINIYVDGVPWDDDPGYQWQSVPSVSGKNGILSLVTLDSESINDGEPVSGAAVSVFDQAPSNDNNIKNLADTYGGGEESSAVDVTVKYKVTLPPGGSFSVLRLVAKKDSIPNDVSDGDKIVDISPSKTKKTVTGLDENSLYYFKIFAEDINSNTSESDEKHITTSGDEGWLFDYTGQIQTFTAPKTGIYQLETWGAQGGDATDGTNTARGGYGAYAVGEVFLTQGETLYINVGGQNGYGGGGNYVPPYIEIEPSILDNNIFVSSQSDAGYSPSSYGANYYITLFPDTVSHFDNAKCILTGQQNKSAYTHTTDGQGNDIMSYSNNNTYSISVLAIPLGDLYDVSKIAFSYKIDTSGYEYKFINMWTANIDTSTGSVIESVSIFADNESKSWTDTEVNVNKQMNYLIVQTCNGQNALKDIKVYL